MKHELTGVVLAAGTSSRMGVNKLLLRRPDRPLLRTVCERVLAAGIEQVVVVLGHEHERVEPLLVDLSVATVLNTDYRNGMATSVAAGVRAAKESSAGYLFALADMPEIRVETYRRLCQAFQGESADAIVLPCHGGQRGNPVLFARRYRAELLSLRGDQGARQLFDAYADHVLQVAVDDPGILIDIDEPDQL